MTRVAIAGIRHETNTYCQDTTPTAAFHQRRGAAILRERDTGSAAGGAMRACERLGFEVVPILITAAQPSGTIRSETYESFRQEILAGIDAARPVDAVCLDLHGAGVVEHLEDLEGDLATAVRDLLGEAVPIVAVFDLHGNVTQAMADALDGVFACHHYPHVDFHERADEAIRLIDDMLRENFRPVTHIETVPMLLPTTTTFAGIGKSMLEEMLEAELPDDVIDVSWFHGFPYTDIEHVGCHVAVTVRGDRERARTVARSAAESLWRRRDAFRPVLSTTSALFSKPGKVLRASQFSSGSVMPNRAGQMARLHCATSSRVFRWWKWRYWFTFARCSSSAGHKSVHRSTHVSRTDRRGSRGSPRARCRRRPSRGWSRADSRKRGNPAVSRRDSGWS